MLDRQGRPRAILARRCRRRYDCGMADTAAFDTLATARKLKAAGITEAHAEAIAECTAASAHAAQSELASKADIAALKADIAALKTDIAGIKTDAKADIAALKTNIAGIKTDAKADIAGIKADVKADIAGLEARFYRAMLWQSAFTVAVAAVAIGLMQALG